MTADDEIAEIREAIKIAKGCCLFAAILAIGMIWGVIAALRWAFS